jgi:hypothetical protein
MDVLSEVVVLSSPKGTYVQRERLGGRKRMDRRADSWLVDWLPGYPAGAREVQDGDEDEDDVGGWV